MSSTSVLVTGGTGFIGAHVVSALRRRGERVTVLGRRAAAVVATSSEGGAAHEPPAFLKADLGAGAVDLAGGPYQVVYHVAGLAHVVPKTDAERKRFHEVNVNGTA